jgi:hypothetical protein
MTLESEPRHLAAVNEGDVLMCEATKQSSVLIGLFNCLFEYAHVKHALIQSHLIMLIRNWVALGAVPANWGHCSLLWRVET